MADVVCFVMAAYDATGSWNLRRALWKNKSGGNSHQASGVLLS